MEEPTMTNSMRRRPTLIITAALCALPACSTRELGPNGLQTHREPTSPHQATLLIQTCHDPDDVPYLLAMNFPPGHSTVEYAVFIDGQRLVHDDFYSQRTNIVSDAA